MFQKCSVRATQKVLTYINRLSMHRGHARFATKCINTRKGECSVLISELLRLGLDFERHVLLTNSILFNLG